MKKLILISGLILMVSCQEKSKLDPNINPFFQDWTTPYEVPPFMDIKNEDYMPRLEIKNAIKKHCIGRKNGTTLYGDGNAGHQIAKICSDVKLSNTKKLNY